MIADDRVEYNYIKDKGGAPIFMFDKYVPPFEAEAIQQLLRVSRLPFVTRVAAMPDTHVGVGATIGSVVATQGAIIPASVGVDIGCGMLAAKTSLTADMLPDNLDILRYGIEEKIPHGGIGAKAGHDIRNIPSAATGRWERYLGEGFSRLVKDYPELAKSNNINHLGTLGSGNHFIEVCIDGNDEVWILLHSGSRGVGNKIGRIFIDLAKEAVTDWHIKLEDMNLAYLPESSHLFDDYTDAVLWAQKFAELNREIMLCSVCDVFCYMENMGAIPRDSFRLVGDIIDCHHNYVAREHHFGANVLVTRKGAVRARVGDMCIIPGSMGAKSYICEGLGMSTSLESCSHGAGRVMSRSKAKRSITIEEHKAALSGVSCNTSANTLDESPAAYKDIDAVMASQTTLVKPIHELKQVVCVKG